MKNAHLRFGHLIYTKALKKTTTRFKVPLDRFIGESESNSVVRSHLISVIGGDTQIAGVAAAVANNDSFTVETPDHAAFRVTLGDRKSTRLNSSHTTVSRMPSSA